MIDDHFSFTKGKTYVIHSFVKYTTKYEYSMCRDDGELGLWWESEIDTSFVNLKEARKLKLKKIINGKI